MAGLIMGNVRNQSTVPREQRSEALHEHSAASFDALIDAIVALGFDEETAGRYASLIGDTPVLDSEGKIVVLDHNGKELFRIPLDYFNRMY